MGMAASQARLLSITSRLHDVEYKAQNLQNAKLQLSTQQDAAYEDYLKALDARTLTFQSIDAFGNRSDLTATFNNLFSVNAANTATGNHYALIDSRGRVIVTEDVERGYDDFTHSGEIQNANRFALYMLFGDEGNHEFDNAANAVLNERIGTDSHLADLYDYAINGRSNGRGERNVNIGGNNNNNSNIDTNDSYDSYEYTPPSNNNQTPTPEINPEQGNNTPTADGVDPDPTPNPSPRPSIIHNPIVQAERLPSQEAPNQHPMDRSNGNNGNNGNNSGTNSSVRGADNGSKGSSSGSGSKASTNDNRVNTGGTRGSSNDNRANSNPTPSAGAPESSAENSGIQLLGMARNRNVTNTEYTPDIQPEVTELPPEIPNLNTQDNYETYTGSLRDGEASLSDVYNSQHTEEAQQFLNYFFNRYRTEIFNNTQLEASALTNFDYYVRMFNAIQQQGGCISIDDFNGPDGSAANNSEWLTAMIESGQFSLRLFNTDAQGNVTLSGTSVDSDENLSFTATTQIDKRALAKAEAAYEHALKVIDNKEKKIDMELNKIETERNALTKEYDSAKKIIEENVDRTFGIFS